MKYLVLAIALATLAGINTARAGQNEDIEACVAKVQEFTGRSVDMFDARYKKGGWLGNESVHWSGIDCEVQGLFGTSTVFQLYVDGKHLVVDGYAGVAAQAASEQIARDVESAIETLEARIDILKGMQDQADKKLRSVDADADAITAQVNKAIVRVTQ